MALRGAVGSPNAAPATGTKVSAVGLGIGVAVGVAGGVAGGRDVLGTGSGGPITMTGVPGTAWSGSRLWPRALPATSPRSTVAAVAVLRTRVPGLPAARRVEVVSELGAGRARDVTAGFSITRPWGAALPCDRPFVPLPECSTHFGIVGG